MFNQSCESHSSHYRANFANSFRMFLKLIPVSFAFVAGAAMAQSSAVDCQCRAPGGQMRDLGYVECVDIVGTQNLVRCVMSTNTPYWKKLEGVVGCPSA
jgi:hypothetical protein